MLVYKGTRKAPFGVGKNYQKMEVASAKFLSTNNGGTNNTYDVYSRRSSTVTPNSSPKLSRLFPRINRQKSKSLPGSRRGSLVSNRSGLSNGTPMDQIQIAFKRGFYKGSPRSSSRSNRLPKSGDLRILSPYELQSKPVVYGSNDTIYRSGRHGYYKVNYFRL